MTKWGIGLVVVFVALMLVGCMADQGPTGVQGVQGVQGPQGDDGRDGINGEDGENGADGADGSAGQDGQEGEDGEDGEDGVDGQDGQDGAIGPQGPAGVSWSFEYLTGSFSGQVASICHSAFSQTHPPMYQILLRDNSYPDQWYPAGDDIYGAPWYQDESDGCVHIYDFYYEWDQWLLIIAVPAGSSKSDPDWDLALEMFK